VLEPRRIAARASAERMAKTLGERVGETVGYRVRFGSKVSRATRIEVVTEGIFSRQILDDPELTGVAAVLFDEFHERSLDADLGLALARDAQVGLREDLRILKNKRLRQCATCVHRIPCPTSVTIAKRPSVWAGMAKDKQVIWV
jgi:ATP-dependent helicase HrpB